MKTTKYPFTLPLLGKGKKEGLIMIWWHEEPHFKSGEWSWLPCFWFHDLPEQVNAQLILAFNKNGPYSMDKRKVIKLEVKLHWQVYLNNFQRTQSSNFDWSWSKYCKSQDRRMLKIQNVLFSSTAQTNKKQEAKCAGKSIHVFQLFFDKNGTNFCFFIC